MKKYIFLHDFKTFYKRARQREKYKNILIKKLKDEVKYLWEEANYYKSKMYSYKQETLNDCFNKINQLKYDHNQTLLIYHEEIENLKKNSPSYQDGYKDAYKKFVKSTIKNI